MNSKLKVEKIYPHSMIPTRSTNGSVGFDLYSVEKKIIQAGDRALISTGLRLQPPEG